MSDKAIRLSRLFDKGRCLDIAIDHGFFGESAFLTGIEDLNYAVRTLVDASPDAIQLTIGQARLLQEIDSPPSSRTGLTHGCCKCLRKSLTKPHVQSSYF